MAKLKRDERTCPYCAEVIKAAAVRCRYCYSDLTPATQDTPAAEPEQAEEEPKQAEEPAEQPEPTEPVEEKHPTASGLAARLPAVLEVSTIRRLPALLLGRLTTVLVVLVVLAAAGVAVAWWQTASASTATAPDGSLVSQDARTQVVVTAADLAQRALSYDHETLENDMETARAKMTPQFREEYDATMEQVRANTLENEIVLEATVVSSAIIEASEQEASVLVFLNQTTTAGAGDDANQQINQNSVVVTLERDGGDWAMSNLKALG